VEETKLTGILIGSVRYRYENQWDEKWKYGFYAGCGILSLSTPIVERVNDDGSKIYYTIDAFDMFGGVQLKYRRIGCFLEYHHNTLNLSKRVSNDFGNSFLNLGLSWSF
jgi:hypothetical protein